MGHLISYLRQIFKGSKPTRIVPSQHAFLSALQANPSLMSVVTLPSSLSWALTSTPWNLRVYPIPLAVLRPTSADQVAMAVKLATAHGIAVQARSGGHSFGSHSLGGDSGAFVIDLSAFSQVEVFPEEDPKALWRAEIGGGTLLGKVTQELYKQGGRAMAHGTCPSVGVGQCVIGGQGPTSRLWGLLLDHLVAAEIVTADGSVKVVDAEHDPDLFWAIRGAGASFGVITKFTFVTHPALNDVEYYVFQYTLAPPPNLSGALQAWQTYLLQPSTLEDRSFNTVFTIGPDSFIVNGSRLDGGDWGREKAEKLKTSLEAHLGELTAKKEFRTDWLGHAEQWAQDEIFNLAGGKNTKTYLKSLTIRKDKPLTKQACDALFDYLKEHPLGHGMIWFILGDFELGRIADFANDSTPYAQRDALFTFAAYVIDPIPRRKFPRQGIEFLDGLVGTIKAAMPDGGFGAYPGYIDPGLKKDEYPTVYWGGNYDRLKKIKRQYDPQNTFRNPQSVEVASE